MTAKIPAFSDRPVVTIAIPTYNRPACLERQLARLADQIGSEEKRVEILVCDNASQQDLQGLMAGFRPRFWKLTYHRNPTNLGFFGNIFRAYELATGRYVWYVSDDDEILEGAVMTVCELLQREDHTVLTLSCDSGDGATPQPRDYHSLDATGALAALETTIFISTLVLRKETLPTAQLARGAPHAFPQMTLALLLLKRNLQLAHRDVVTVKRIVGRVTNDFFQLYCLDLLEAVRQSDWPEVECRLIAHFGGHSLRAFVRLQLLERVGRFQSRRGLPWATWKRGWRELGWNFTNCVLLIVILVTSRVPRRVARGACWLALALRHFSRHHASATMRGWLQWQSEARAADV